MLLLAQSLTNKPYWFLADCETSIFELLGLDRRSDMSHFNDCLGNLLGNLSGPLGEGCYGAKVCYDPQW